VLIVLIWHLEEDLFGNNIDVIMKLVEKKYRKEKDIEAYVTDCKSLNNHIIDEKGFNLSDSYELGQAYFMKPKNLTKKELDRVWLENISPILKEYLRAEYPEKEIIGKT